MATQTTSIQPLEYAKETLLGMTLALEQRFGCTPRNDTGTTLNTKYNVFPTRLPTNKPVVQYFCWGVGGRVNDSTTLSSAQFVLGTNMALYKPRPFRAVPLEEDLSTDERDKYGMRVVKTIGGVPYCLYYLKRIDFTQSQVQYIRTDPVSGVATPYQIDYDNLNPSVPIGDDNGVISDVADSISIVLPGQLVITGQEVLESMAVIDGGDTRYAYVSEIGSVSASREQVSAQNFEGNSFNYYEAIFAQMVDQYNWVGQPFMSSETVFSRTINYSLRNVIVQS